MLFKPSYSRLTSLVALALLSSNTWSAGCVATSGASMHHSFQEPDIQQSPLMANELQQSEAQRFLATFAYRHFKSDRHFVGDKEQKHRQQEGSEVINNSRFMDFTLSYFVNERWSTNFTLPLVLHDRSQVVRDDARNILDRFHTQSAGIGDIRVSADYWLLNPQQFDNGNILLGFGLDLPTGQKDETDIFMKYDAVSGKIIAEERNVDQSIQPGDGGWGLILNVYGYKKLMPELVGYLSAAYTITPEEKNGVMTYRSNPYEAEMSIADNYLLRTGIDYKIWPEKNLVTGLGVRMAGVPVNDLLGGSKGFRRPGYDISIEPTVAIDVDVWSFSLSVPVAIDRNRQRSVADEQQADSTGTPRHGDAAFADYEILFSVSKRF